MRSYLRASKCKRNMYTSLSGMIELTKKIVYWCKFFEEMCRKYIKQELCLWNTMPPAAQLWSHIFYLWPWRMTLTFHHSKCAAPWHTHACRIWSCYLQYCKIWPLTLTLKDDLDLSPINMCSSMRYACTPILKKLWPMLKFLDRQTDALYLTFDLEGWPSPSPFTTENVQLHEMHMYAKYQVAMFNIKKVMAIKVFGRTDRLTHWLTDWQFNWYRPPYRGHKKQWRYFSQPHNC